MGARRGMEVIRLVFGYGGPVPFGLEPEPKYPPPKFMDFLTKLAILFNVGVRSLEPRLSESLFTPST